LDRSHRHSEPSSDLLLWDAEFLQCHPGLKAFLIGCQSRGVLLFMGRISYWSPFFDEWKLGLDRFGQVRARLFVASGASRLNGLHQVLIDVKPICYSTSLGSSIPRGLCIVIATISADIPNFRMTLHPGCSTLHRSFWQQIDHLMSVHIDEDRPKGASAAK